MRLATFNVENLDSDDVPFLQQRVGIMRPQLQRIDADILCLQEVHSEDVNGVRALEGLDQLIFGTPYANYDRATTLTTGGDLYAERNLVTLSRSGMVAPPQIRRDSDGPRPVYQQFTADPPDNTAEALQWERPILHTQHDLGDGRTLHVLNLHLKSKLPTSIPGQKTDSYTWQTVSAWAEGSFISSMKRVGQAVQTRLVVDDIFDREGEDAVIAVCGDFNADADEVPMKAICGHVEETGNPVHARRIMIPCERNIPESARFSLYHLGVGQMLDHILASRALFAHFDRAEIHNEALPDESGAFRRDTKFPESDHAPVVAEFDLD